MVYTYTPTYYSSLHDSITSICKTILPFSFKKRRLPAAEQKLSKQQSDNLKWQQDSFHQILNLMGLHKEGILSETEVSAFRSHLLDTLIASPAYQEQPAILRDKLLFLQELFYAKCISVDEYHSSKRPLVQRLAVQGAEIEARDIIVAGPKDNSEEEWSVIDLRDEQCLLNKESLHSKNKSKNGSTMKQIKGAASVLGFVSSHKHGKKGEENGVIGPGVEHLRPIAPSIPSSVSAKNEIGFFGENPFWDTHLSGKEIETRSILMPESLPPEPVKENGDKVKKKPFRTLFQREQREGHGGGGDPGPDSEERVAKSAKKQWGFDGFKKWKRSNSEDETAPLPLSERSDSEAFMGRLVESPIGEGPDTKQIKRKLHSDGSASDFFIDKVLGEKIKKELSRIQSELNTTNPNLQFSNDQIEAISTKLPVDKADLKKFFPKSWCDRYGDVVLDVVKKEFKDHVGEMENLRNAAREKHGSSTRWTTFEDDENCHPNLFVHQDHSLATKQQMFTPSKGDRAYINKNSSSANGYECNPFLQDYTEKNGNTLRAESAFFQDQNPFWTPRHGSSMLG
ncbi:hypothetical protein L1049_000062 [Liquidambar formosana]|uniref:Uncharacterized protein n=1 Tax=Liquidambar formosana TaxID=63359 RepID=A0AAP0NBN7_LIQFO